MAGSFVVSLDFELMWGVMDKRTIESYGQNIKSVHAVVPSLLKLFNKYKVKSTFSTVGMLFHKDLKSLKSKLPTPFPTYDNPALSPYNYFDSIAEETYYLASELIELIQADKNHEIGTHTYCHYYCLEPGQTIASFREDLTFAKEVAKERGIEISTLVFPRNQYNKEYLSVCRELGVIGYRGNEEAWIYRAGSGQTQNKLKRAIRLMDAYVNLSGHHVHSNTIQDGLMDVKASRFLRPYSKKLKFLEGLRLKRIKNSMLAAAKNSKTFHLWWHPHNFGANQQENFDFLEKILTYYEFLSDKYDMQSHSMKSLILENNEA